MIFKQLCYFKEYLIIKWSNLFDAHYYAQEYPDARESISDPLMHFIKQGWREGKNPSAKFNTVLYLELNPDVENAELNPLVHYIKHGIREQRRAEHFDSEKINLTYIDLDSKDKLNQIIQSNTEDPPRTADVLIFPIIDWFFRFQRPQQIALELAKLGHRIFYFKTGFYKGDLPKIKEIEENIFSVQLAHGNKKTQFNTALSDEDVEPLINSIRILKDLYLINTAIMLVDLPFWNKLTAKLKARYGWKLVYDCMDLHEGFSTSTAETEVDEQALLKNSDLVIATSHFLWNKVKTIHQNTILVPNGTDFDFFHQAKQPLQHMDLESFSSPIIGYYGAIADWFDTHLIGTLASRHPEWTFLLIGNTHLADLKPIDHLQNVHLLGEKAYKDIPNYLSHFDVCLIPFKPCPLTNATNPVKLYEYLSAGKPVVATKLDELIHYTDYVKLAENTTEWEEAILKSIAEEKTPELLDRRFSFARKNTWQQRTAVIKTEVMKLFPKVSIIVVTFHNQTYTQQCLDSLIKNTSYPNYEVIIVDNGSDEEMIDFLTGFSENYHHIQLVLNHINLGFAKANNQGAKMAQGEYLVFLNNDTIVTPGWVTRLLWHLEKNRKAGMVGPVTNAISNEAKIHVNYANMDINKINA